MKTMLTVAAMIVLLGVTVVSTAIASSQKSVVVTNNTTYTMTEFYASSSDASSWDTSNNLFAGQTLAPGQSTTINVSGGEEDECHYDLMAVLFGTTQAAYTYSVDACDGGSWNITGM